MAKIIAHFSKKASGQAQYSSNQFSASIEIESDSEDPEAIQTYLRRCFEIAKTSVDEQMRAASGPASNGQRTNAPAIQRTPLNGYRNGGLNNGQPSHQPSNGNGNGNGNGNSGGGGRFAAATQAQQKAVYAICKSLGCDPNQYDVKAMSVSQASKLIDELKGQQAAN